MDVHFPADIFDVGKGSAGMKSNFQVWSALLILTGVEVALAYLQVSPGWMLFAMVGLSTVKAILIAGWFMHLRFERTSLFLALIPTLTVL